MFLCFGPKMQERAYCFIGSTSTVLQNSTLNTTTTTIRPDLKNRVNLQTMFVYIFPICVNFFILPAVSSVKPEKGLYKKNISNLDCINFSCFFRSA